MSRRLSKLDALKVLTEKRIKLCSDYVDSSTPVELKCLVCGREWTSTVTRVKIYDCKDCKNKLMAKARTTPITEVRKILLEKGVQYISGFENSHSRIKVKHLSCGHVTDNQQYSVLKNGTGCNICYFTSNTEYEDYARRHGGKVIRIASSVKKSLYGCARMDVLLDEVLVR